MEIGIVDDTLSCYQNTLKRSNLQEEALLLSSLLAITGPLIPKNCKVEVDRNKRGHA